MESPTIEIYLKFSEIKTKIASLLNKRPSELYLHNLHLKTQVSHFQMQLTLFIVFLRGLQIPFCFYSTYLCRHLSL